MEKTSIKTTEKPVPNIDGSRSDILGASKTLPKKPRKKAPKEMEKLLAGKDVKPIPKIGDLIEGEIISITKKEIHLDVDGLTTGVIRGYELLDESGEYASLKKGEKISAVVLDLENENGEMELSFRQAGHEKAWLNLKNLMEKKETITVQVIEANRGGLVVKYGQLTGFLPTSHLSIEHYPRVERGEKDRIFEKLKQLINKHLKVKIIDIFEEEEKVVVSEKSVTKEDREKSLAKYKLGDIIEGKIIDFSPFGAFLRFGDNIDGLVHISEIAWQRISRPQDFLKIGEKTKAEIIGIEGSKVFLSIKKLTEDPWKKAAKKYKSGQKVKGKVFRITPFGLFIELEKDIQGLVHVSEFSLESIENPSQAAKVGDVLEFRITTIEPEDHRIGLSMRETE